jgi:hypothetical protein
MLHYTVRHTNYMKARCTVSGTRPRFLSSLRKGVQAYQQARSEWLPPFRSPRRQTPAIPG